jgi:hypothetical protein
MKVYQSVFKSWLVRFKKRSYWHLLQKYEN